MRIGCQLAVVHGALAGYELFVDWIVAVGGVDVAKESEMVSGMVLFGNGNGMVGGKGGWESLRRGAGLGRQVCARSTGFSERHDCFAARSAGTRCRALVSEAVCG